MKKPCTIVGVKVDRQRACIRYLVEKNGDISPAWFKESELFGDQRQGIRSVSDTLYNECIERAASWIDTAWALRKAQEQTDEDIILDLIREVKEYIAHGNERTASSELHEKIATMVAQYNPKQIKD